MLVFVNKTGPIDYREITLIFDFSDNNKLLMQDKHLYKYQL